MTIVAPIVHVLRDTETATKTSIARADSCAGRTMVWHSKCRPISTSAGRPTAKTACKAETRVALTREDPAKPPSLARDQMATGTTIVHGPVRATRDMETAMPIINALPDSSAALTTDSALDFRRFWTSVGQGIAKTVYKAETKPA